MIQTTQTVTDIQSLQTTLNAHRRQAPSQTIALVPTMGNLHEGHLELVKVAKTHADVVVVSIFVNPTQFSVGEDLDSYPRTLDADTAKLNEAGVDYIFSPSVSEMYPVMPPPTQVLAGSISQWLCGQSRPTHFDGVGLVVSKLFNIVQPDVAVFGQKDYQQLAIIRQLVRDLSYSIDIIGVPIVRAEDGLALSSRNQYLSDAERAIAPTLNRELNRLADEIRALRQADNPTLPKLQALIANAKNRINDAGFAVDYLEVRRQDLGEVTVQDGQLNASEPLVILTAAKLGKARLLDNVEV